MSKTRLAILFVFVHITASSLSAATFVVPPDRDMVQPANVIVVASALNSRTELRNGKTIETVTVMSVEEVLKGRIDGETFDLYEPGGVYEKRATIIPGVPRFKDGDRYLLFLIKAGGVWRVLNLVLGKFSFETDITGHDLLLRDAAEIAGWDPDRSMHRERRRMAAPFLQFVRATSSGGPANEDYFVRAEPLVGQPNSTPTVFMMRKLKPVPLSFTASSYTYILSGSNGGRWTSFPVTFYSVGSEPGAPGSPAGATAINTAVGAWNGNATSSVNYVYGGADTSGLHNGGLQTPDGQNTIAFERDLTAEFGAPGFSCNSSMYSGLLGIAGFSVAGPGSHIGPNGETFYDAIEVDVEMNKGIANCSYPGFFTGDYNSAVTHEVGHTLGFRHADQTRDLFPGPPSACSAPLECSSSAIMKAFIPSGLSATLQAWDQHAAAAVYPNFAGTVPTGLTATAQTSTSISVTWNTTGAGSYHVYRTSNGINWVQLTPTGATSMTDMTASANTAYLYKVRAFNGTVETADSNLDLATTVIPSNTVTMGATVMALDFTQIRTAVNAVETLAGIANTPYTDPTLDSTVTIKKAHIDELVSRLNTARTTLGLSGVSLSGGMITQFVTPVRASDVTDLRSAVQ